MTCLPSKGVDSNLPRKSIFSKKLIVNCPKMIARRDVYRKGGIRPLLLEPTKAVGMTGELAEGKYRDCAGEKQALWRRRKSVQASRKCTFAPLAGAKAPDPYAAFRRELARPQAAERKNGRQVQNRRGRWWRPPPRIVRHRKPCAGFLFSSLYPNRLKRKSEHTPPVGDSA